MVHSLHAFHQYLLDKPFELHTDNASLQWLNRQWLVSHHHERWLNTIGKFTFTIIHIPGCTNPADFLSRMCFSSGTEQAQTAGYTNNGREEDAKLFVVPGSPAATFAAVASDPAAPCQTLPRPCATHCLQTLQWASWLGLHRLQRGHRSPLQASQSQGAPQTPPLRALFGVTTCSTVARRQGIFCAFQQQTGYAAASSKSCMPHHWVANSAATRPCLWLGSWYGGHASRQT